MLLDATHLTFGEIANRWADENAAHPGALGRDQILKRLEGGLENDEFDYAELTIWREVRDKLRDNENWERQDAKWMPVTRDDLHYILFRVRDPITKRILESLRISQKGFRQWCKKQNFSLPTFWFDVADSDALSKTSDQLSGQNTKRQVSAVNENSPRRGGRYPTYDWPAFHAEIAHRVGNDPDGFPLKQADLERDMTMWCEETWGEDKTPVESTIREQITKYYLDEMPGR